MRNRHDRSAFVAVVRWDGPADCQAFIAAEPANPEAFRTIFAAMTLLSTEV
jgi:hypothetical protein